MDRKSLRERPLLECLCTLQTLNARTRACARTHTDPPVPCHCPSAELSSVVPPLQLTSSLLSKARPPPWEPKGACLSINVAIHGHWRDICRVVFLAQGCCLLLLHESRESRSQDCLCPGFQWPLCCLPTLSRAHCKSTLEAKPAKPAPRWGRHPPGCAHRRF